MVIAAFPLAKIGLLILKQLSKPIANIVKNEAKKHPYVRKYVIIPTGKAYGRVEAFTLYKGKAKDMPPMTDEEIVELGSNAIGEIVLFALLASIVVAEYTRQGDKKAVIQRTKDDEIANIVDTILEVIEEVETLKKSVNQIKSDLDSAFDVIELEDQRHSVVHDHNFLDVMVGNKRKFGRLMNENKWDATSPSA